MKSGYGDCCGSRSSSHHIRNEITEGANEDCLSYSQSVYYPAETDRWDIMMEMNSQTMRMES